MLSNKFASLWILGVVVGLAMAGCSSSNSSRPTYSTGVDNTKQVSTLDKMQLQEICESYDVYVNTYVDLDAVAYIACLPTAILTTRTPDACQATLRQCMSVFPKPIQVSAKAKNVEVCARDLQQCQATVAQLESCVNVNVDQALQVYQGWSCDRVGDANIRAMADNRGTVDVCTQVNGACNKFAEVTPE